MCKGVPTFPLPVNKKTLNAPPVYFREMITSLGWGTYGQTACEKDRLLSKTYRWRIIPFHKPLLCSRHLPDVFLFDSFDQNCQKPLRLAAMLKPELG